MSIITESYDDIAAHLLGETYEKKQYIKKKKFTIIKKMFNI